MAKNLALLPGVASSELQLLRESHMGIPVEVLEAERLQLPKADRIRVLDADAARDAAWDAFAKQPRARVEADPSQMLVLDEVLANLRSGLQ